MAKLYLGTRGGAIAYGGGYYEIPRYESDGRAVYQRQIVLNGTEFAGITTAYNNSLANLFYNMNSVSGTFSMPDLEEIRAGGLQSVGFSTNIDSISFPNLRTVRDSGLYQAFYRTRITSISFPKLELVSRTGFAGAFTGLNFTSADIIFPKLKKIDMQGFQETFALSTAVVIRFPVLDEMSYGSCMSMCRGCTTIEHIYFNALKTTSFAFSECFDYMMRDTGTTTTHTIHFPSNLESTVQTLSGYPLFGGTNGSVVLAFDLPATS